MHVPDPIVNCHDDTDPTGSHSGRFDRTHVARRARDPVTRRTACVRPARSLRRALRSAQFCVFVEHVDSVQVTVGQPL